MSKRCMGCMELFGNEFEICPHCGYIEGTKAEEAIHMEPGTLLHDRYIIGKVLGFGGFGVTYIGWDGKLEQKVAIKEYLPSEFSTRMPGQSSVTVFNGDKSEQFSDGLQKFVEEAKRLAKFQNEPGIVKVFDSFTENETAYIVMEFLDGETLTERLKRDKTIPEDEAVSMLWSVMESLQVVHQEGILHRDIAPDNVFLTKSGDVKLIDFGASRYATTSHSRSLTVIIKPGYSPEEQYRSRGDQGSHTDVYALAATLYKMITGKTPADAMERRAKVENQKKEILEDPRKLNKHISRNRENAILNAMNVRIEDRTPDVLSFMNELNADPPVKRRYGKIKRIDLYFWPLWLKILLPSILAFLIIFGALLGAGVIEFPSLFSDKVEIPEGVVVVPDVEGLEKDEALKLIKDSNLTPSPEGNIESEYVEAGKIVLQTPTGGTYLEENGIVVLTVSSGLGVIEVKNGVSTVPYVIWDTQEDAVAKLKEAGLAEPIIKTQSDDNVMAGRVISQSVESGTTVDEGTQITIIVSSGPSTTANKTTANQTTSNNTKVVVSFNANGGSVEISNKTVSLTETYGTLPTPSRDYYTFAGWYTATSGGSKVTAATKVSNSNAHTLYARWTENGVSGWVLASDVPADAKIIDQKWTYDLTTNITSNNKTESGYTLYDTSWAWGNYGSWSSWSTTKVASSDSREVQTKEVTDQAGYTRYRYWRYVNSNGTFAGTYGYNGCYTYQEIYLTYSLGITSTGYYGPALYNGGYSYIKNVWFFGESSWVPAVTHTEYRYRDRSKVYTYYHTKTESKESSNEVSASSSISNVQKWVKYQTK